MNLTNVQSLKEKYYFFIFIELGTTYAKGLFVHWSFRSYLKTLKHCFCATPRHTECGYITCKSLMESEIICKLPEPCAHHGMCPVSSVFLQKKTTKASLYH